MPELKKLRDKLIKIMREQFEEWHVNDIESGLANSVRDTSRKAGHATISGDAIRLHCDTPQLQDEMREAFYLTLNLNSGRWRQAGDVPADRARSVSEQP